MASAICACGSFDPQHKIGRECGQVQKLTLASAPPAAEPVGMKLVPMIPTAEMNRVMDSEGWCWEDVLAAAGVITEDEYQDIAASGTHQPEPVRPTQEQAQAVAEFLHDKYACWQGVGMLDVLEVWEKLNEQMCACAQPAQPATQAGAAEPLAWMHDEPGRVDVIHHKVKELLEDQHAKGYSSPDYMHRPLGKVEHYTIPLYAQPTEQPSQDANPTR